MANPVFLTTALIEQTLLLLYGGMDLSEEVRSYRAMLAHELHRRTGKWFAARFY